MKSFSIIAIVLFALCFFSMIGWTYDTASSAIGAGAVACIFGLAFAITVLVKTVKKTV